MKEKLQLMELVRHVAEELRESQITRDESKPTVMKFKECEITASFQVEVEANGKVKLWAAEMGAKGNQSTMHTIKLKYEAEGADVVCTSISLSDELDIL